MLSLPTETDWRSEVWCLDAEAAYRDFRGKTHDEAVELFRDNALYYQESVMFMPARCFPFYANAYMAYLRSPQAEGDADAANCFFGLIDHRLSNVVRAGDGFAKSVIETLHYLGENQDWYDAKGSIYRSFRDRADRLAGQLETLLSPR